MKDMVHYICAKVDSPNKLGAIKLNKILFFSDSITYLNEGESITGETYIKRQYGPVPKSILPIISELVTNKRIVTRDKKYQGITKREYISLKEPNLKEFFAEEIALIDNIINFVCDGHTAESISDLTHDDIWEMAEIGEEIPLNAAFVAYLGEIDESDVKWGMSSIKEIENSQAI